MVRQGQPYCLSAERLAQQYFVPTARICFQTKEMEEILDSIYITFSIIQSIDF